MGITLELSKSDRVACRSCGKRIKKGILKGVIAEKGFSGYDVKVSYCKECIKIIILKKIDEFQAQLKMIEEDVSKI